MFTIVKTDGADSKLDLCSLISDLDLQLNLEKLHTLRDVMNTMGIMVDAISHTVSIPPEKMTKISQTVNSFLEKKLHD